MADVSRNAGPTPEERQRAARIRAKQARGEPLTMEEAGFLGALAVMEKDVADRREAEREGRLEAFEEQSRVKSWMKGEETREPQLSGRTREEVERIRAKQARGEALTLHEAGVLGGATRATDAQQE